MVEIADRLAGHAYPNEVLQRRGFGNDETASLQWMGMNAERENDRRCVVVVGGGLAGMACAAALAERGAERLKVTLLESRHAAGGTGGVV